MKVISDRQLRRQLRDLLNEGQKLFPKESYWKLNLQGVDDTVKFFAISRKEARQTSRMQFEQQLSFCYLLLLTFSFMVLAIDLKKRANQPIQSNRLGRKKPNPNFVFQGLLVQVVNYSLAVVRLVEDGLDNPARCILRTLNELTSQMIVLLADQSQMNEYAMAHNSQDAKRVWYTLFAKKSRLKKSLTKLEKQFGVPDDLLTELRAIRDEIDLDLSESVHHSFVSTTLRAYAPSGLDRMELALAGKSGVNSVQTLEKLINILVYTLHMVVHTLGDIHSFKFPRNDPFWNAAGLLSVSISKITLMQEESSPTP